MKPWHRTTPTRPRSAAKGSAPGSTVTILLEGRRDSRRGRARSALPAQAGRDASLPASLRPVIVTRADPLVEGHLDFGGQSLRVHARPVPPSGGRGVRRARRSVGDEPDREVSVVLLAAEADHPRPVLHAIFRPWVRGEEHVPELGGAILAEQPPVVLRLDLPAARPAPARHVPGQVRLLHRPRRQGPADGGVLRGAGRCPSTGRAGRPRGGAADRPEGAAPRASCSASTPRARARRTAGCTAARPASPGSRSRRACRSSRSR